MQLAIAQFCLKQEIVSREKEQAVLITHVKEGKSFQKQMFFKIGALKNFANFNGKHLCWCLFLIKLQGLFHNLQGKNYMTSTVSIFQYP